VRRAVCAGQEFKLDGIIFELRLDPVGLLYAVPSAAPWRGRVDVAHLHQGDDAYYYLFTSTIVDPLNIAKSVIKNVLSEIKVDLIEHAVRACIEEMGVKDNKYVSVCYTRNSTIVGYSRSVIIGFNKTLKSQIVKLSDVISDGSINENKIAPIIARITKPRRQRNGQTRA
jgi:hypothetical protein